MCGYLNVGRDFDTCLHFTFRLHGLRRFYALVGTRPVLLPHSCYIAGMGHIEFIYFDLGRVLLDFTHERGYRQIAELISAREEFVRQILLDQGLGERYEAGELTTEEFHLQFSEAADTEIDQAALCLAWADIFEIMPQTVRLAASLRAAGYQIGILSNTCEAHWEFANGRFSILAQLFSPVITSYEVKSMKPEQKIYEIAAERAGAEPHQLLFMDDRQENVDGAREQGWSALHFENALQAATELERYGLEFGR